MSLKKRIDQILFEKEINLKTFLDTIGMSKGTYYKIKNGEKDSLNSTHAEAIKENYGYGLSWLMGNEINEPSAGYGINEKILNCKDLGVILNKNHYKLMQENDTYKLFIEKIAHAEAMKILKDKFL